MFTVTVLKNDETKSYDQTKKTQAIPIIPGLKRSFYNRAFQVMLLLSLFEALRGLLWSGLYPFFFTKVLALDDPQYQLWGGIYNVLGMVLASLFTPLWQWASRRYGYYRTWLFSYLVQIPIGTVLYFTIDVGQQQVYRYLVFFILLCISGRASGFLYDSIKASMYDYDELYTGERREASIDASLSILPKYISLVSNSVSFGILSRFESDPITAGKCIAVQTTLLPSLTATICFLIMLQFPVTDKKHEQVKKGIELHQQGKSAHDPIHNQSVPVPVLKQQDILMDYFFDFELSNKKRIKYISIGSFILCTVTFLSCTVFFVQKTIYEKGNDTVATFALWLASVTFTLGLFFRERIQVINQITTFDKKSLSQSEHYEVVPEPKKLK
jgi:Na+/melibiose symporter-like transporter